MTPKAHTTFCAAEKLLQELFTGRRAQRVARAGLNCCVYPRFALMCLFVLAALQSVCSLVGGNCLSYCELHIKFCTAEITQPGLPYPN